MPNESPYRYACGGYNTGRTMRVNHRRDDHREIPVYNNLTVAPNPACVEGCEEVDPNDCICPPNCDPLWDCDGGSSTVAPFSLTPCDEADPPCGQYPTIPPVTVEGDQILANFFSDTPAGTLDFSTCRKIGFKNLQARKAWHGRFGFLHNEGCCEPETEEDCCHEPERPSPATTKYLGKRTVGIITGTLHEGVGCPSTEVSITIIRDVLVDRYSGQMKIIQCVDDINVPEGCTNPVNSGLDNLILLMETEKPCGVWGHDWIENPDDYPCLVINRTIANDEITINVSFTLPEFGDPCYPGEPMFYSHTYTVTNTLYAPYTSEDVNEDLNALLRQWNLADDLQYPWRTDNNCSTAPLIIYNEQQAANVPVTGGIECDYVELDPRPYPEADYGAMIGVPLPTGVGMPVSTQGYWNWRHVTWVYDGDTLTWSIASIGARSPFPHATLWNNNREAIGLPRGAWKRYNTGSVLEVQEWAEIILFVRPSYNFARPCGTDKTAIDQTTITCFEGEVTYAGDLRFPDAPCFCKDPTQTTDCETPENPAAVYKWNDSGKKGDYILKTWEYDHRDYGENLRLRNAYTARLAENIARAAEDPPRAACDTLDNPAELRPITGALKTFTVEQKCIGFMPCRPVAVFITTHEPEGDYEPLITGAQWYSIPELVLDERYGNTWQRDIQQQMDDPLWQAPHIPCDLEFDGGTWLEDDGTCKADTFDPLTFDEIRYYAMRPFVEARCDPAFIGMEQSPNLPAGIYLNVLDVDDLNAGTTTGVDRSANPDAGNDGDGQPRPFETPWGILLKQEECARNDCRFAVEYRANGIHVESLPEEEQECPE